MDILTPEQVRTLRQNLPQELKDAFSSPELADGLFALVKRYNLRTDISGLLSDEINRVILGVTRPDNFLQSIQKRLALPPNTTADLVRDIDGTIFEPIRAALHTLHVTQSAESKSLENRNTIVTNKLSGPTHTSHNTPQRNHDPYREPIE